MPQISECIGLLKESLLFRASTDRFIKNLSQYFQHDKVKKGSYICYKGDPSDRLYMIAKGYVDITTISEQGKEVILNVLNRPAFFGQIGFFDQKVRTANVKALSNVELYSISYEDFIQVARQAQVDDWLSILASLSDIARKNSDAIEDIYFLDSRMRMAKTLLYLLKSQEGGSLRIYISQERLSHFIGISREMTNKSLASFERLNLLKAGRGFIDIIDADSLSYFVKEEGDSHENQLSDMAS